MKLPQEIKPGEEITNRHFWINNPSELEEVDPISIGTAWRGWKGLGCYYSLPSLWRSIEDEPPTAEDCDDEKSLFVGKIRENKLVTTCVLLKEIFAFNENFRYTHYISVKDMGKIPNISKEDKYKNMISELISAISPFAAGSRVEKSVEKAKKLIDESKI